MAHFSQKGHPSPLHPPISPSRYSTCLAVREDMPSAAMEVMCTERTRASDRSSSPWTTHPSPRVCSRSRSRVCMYMKNNFVFLSRSCLAFPSCLAWFALLCPALPVSILGPWLCPPLPVSVLTASGCLAACPSVCLPVRPSVCGSTPPVCGCPASRVHISSCQYPLANGCL